MKKIIILLISVAMLCSNVYASENWFVLLPNIDNNANLINKSDISNVKNVDVKFKILEIANDIISK